MVGRFLADELTDEQYETVVQLNQTSVVQTTRALLPLLRRGTHPAIVNTVSISALDRRQRRFLHLFGDQGFRLDLFQGARPRTGAGRHSRQLRFAGHDHHRFPRTLLFGRETRSDPQDHPACSGSARAEDCAPAYLFLASNALSGYITGQVLEVNGGQLIC